MVEEMSRLRRDIDEEGVGESEFNRVISMDEAYYPNGGGRH